MTLANPYQPPAAAAISLPVDRPPDPWKAIAWRWERLRVVYNLVVGLAGVFIAASLPPAERRLDAIVGFGLAANVAYCAGPFAEMYSNWLLDLTANLVPPSLARVLRTWGFTAVYFGLGTLFSVLVTLAVGFAVLFRM